MFGVLIESKARRQRRTGGVAMSVAAHVAIIGAVTAMTVPKPRAERPKIDVYHVHMVKDPPPPTSDVHQPMTSAPRLGPFNRTIDIRLPVPQISDRLPPIDVSHGPPLDSLLLNPGGSAGGSDPRARLGRLDVVGDTMGAREWRGTEALMRVITQGKPRYPESLRQAAIEGRVLVRFTVDTLGLIDPASVTIVSSTHDLFSRAVLSALGGFRFRPAEVNGHRVVALAEMPFEFAIGR
jgi:TonB family protein